MYHRYTNSNSPMSEWGHAMFSARPEPVYGRNHYTHDGRGAVCIEELEQIVKNAWLASQESGDWGEMYDEYYQSLSAGEVFDSLNPQDIVSSAEGWDCDLMVWFWQFVAEPNGITAVLTNDGAIVWDPDLIDKAE